jgi:hypothetical protein
MENKERDLGFFNGIRAELIPLIAGLISFTLLIEDAINEIENIFSLSEGASIFVFITFYFIVPVSFVFIWLTVINHKDGLKRQLANDWKSPFTFLVSVILLLFIVLMAGFFLMRLASYFILVIIIFILVLIYAGCVLIKKPANQIKYRREYRQARYQFGFVFSLLFLFWTFYFLQYYNVFQHYNKCGEPSHAECKDDGQKKWEYGQSDLSSLIQTSANIRSDYRKNTESAQNIISLYPDLIYFSNGDFYDKSKKEILQSFNDLKKDSAGKILNPKEFDLLLLKRVKLIEKRDSVHYVAYRVQQKMLKNFKASWAQWLQLVQVKGLLLFISFIFFLLVIWYHAYKAQLERNSKEDFSEVWISKLSLYVLFLLIIPFFKPIQEDNISFGKPYVTLNKPSYVDNRIITPPAMGDSIRYSSIRTMMADAMKDQRKLLDSIIRYQQKLKKEPNKPRNPYDKSN